MVIVGLVLPAHWTLAAQTNRLDNWTLVSKTKYDKQPGNDHWSLPLFCIWSCRETLYYKHLIVATSIVSLAVNCSLF